MRAFVAGCTAAIVIAVAAAIALNLLGFGSAEVYSSSNVRLPDPHQLGASVP